MIKVTIELEGRDGSRMEITVEDNLTVSGAREEWKKAVASAAATAIKKIQGAIDG